MTTITDLDGLKRVLGHNASAVERACALLQCCRDGDPTEVVGAMAALLVLQHDDIRMLERRLAAASRELRRAGIAVEAA